MSVSEVTSNHKLTKCDNDTGDRQSLTVMTKEISDDVQSDTLMTHVTLDDGHNGTDNSESVITKWQHKFIC